MIILLCGICQRIKVCTLLVQRGLFLCCLLLYCVPLHCESEQVVSVQRQAKYSDGAGDVCSWNDENMQLIFNDENAMNELEFETALSSIGFVANIKRRVIYMVLLTCVKSLALKEYTLSLVHSLGTTLYNFWKALF
jgi:hypothetical protein